MTAAPPKEPAPRVTPPSAPFRAGLVAPGRPSAGPREPRPPARLASVAPPEPEPEPVPGPEYLARLEEELAHRLAEEARVQEEEREAEHAARMADMQAMTIEAEAARAQARELAAQAEVEARRMSELADGLHALQGRVAKEVRAELGPLVLAAARAIAGNALRVESQLLDELVEDAIMSLGRDQLVLRVSPADAPRIRARLPDVLVREDETVEAGCIATGPAGRIDASLGYAADVVAQTIRRWQEGG